MILKLLLLCTICKIIHISMSLFPQFQNKYITGDVIKRLAEVLTRDEKMALNRQHNILL